LWKPRPRRRSTLARGRARRHRQHNGTLDGRHAHRRAEHRFGKADRQIEADIVAILGEEAVRLDIDRHDSVAGAAGAGLALPASRICAPFSQPTGNFRSIVLRQARVMRLRLRMAASVKGMFSR